MVLALTFWRGGDGELSLNEPMTTTLDDVESHEASSESVAGAGDGAGDAAQRAVPVQAPAEAGHS